jgi:hypothetical protein
VESHYAAIKLRLEFDGRRLQDDLRRVLDDEWIAHPYGELGGTFQKGVYHVAALLTEGGAKENITPVVPASQEARTSPVRATPLLERSPYFQEVLESFPCDFNIARLLSMEPGLLLKKHVDRVRSRSYQLARLHIPILTNPKARLFAHGRWIQPQVGECWYLDSGLPHLVRNDGDERRVHLVMDCVVNDFINDLVGFDIVAFRTSRAAEYDRYWRMFRRRQKLRQALHDWNQKVRSAARKVLQRERSVR